MTICLNPETPHVVPGASLAQAICDVPQCGFLLAGAVINRWQVTSLLRRSALADLYLTSRVDSGFKDDPVVMLKVVRAPVIGPNVQWQQRVDQLVALHHPHIHPVLVAGWTNPYGWLYILSPFEAQGSLSRITDTTTRLPPLAVVSIVRQIADALAYAHERMLVHGRLKFENCLLVAPATVQVSDFYYSLLDANIRSIEAPPVPEEQSQGRADAASDQYALALLAYQLLVGRVPALNPGSGSHLLPQPRSLPRLVTELRPDMPRQVDQVLGQALNTQPEGRYPNITTFAFALQQALETTVSGPGWPVDRGISSPPVTPYPGAFSGPSPVTPSHMRSSMQPALSTPGSLTELCLLPGHTSTPKLLRWSPDGIHIASVGNEQNIQLFAIQRRIGAPVGSLIGHEGDVQALSWSPDGSVIASGGSDATVRMWDPVNLTTQAAWWGHDGNVTALDWSPNGLHVASGGVDRTIRLWDRQGNALAVWQAPGRGVTALAWSPDGHILAAGGADHLIALWDSTLGTILATLDNHTDEIHHLQWSPDGGMLASCAGKKDQRVCLWDRATLRLAAVLGGHTREVVGMHWPEDGSWLATATGDAVLRYWDIRRRLGEQMRPEVALSGSLACMAGTPKSSLIALGLANFLIQVMQLEVIS
jgi:eukaryotic-like serine/threonine-protein kinase